MMATIERGAYPVTIPAEVAVLLAVPVGITGIVLLGVAINAVIRRHISMAALMAAVLLASQVAVALAVWGVTNAATTNIIEEQYTDIMAKEGLLAARAVSEELGLGFEEAAAVRERLQQHALNYPNETFLAPGGMHALSLLTSLQMVLQTTKPMLALIAGSEDGAFVSGSVNSMVPNEYRLSYLAPHRNSTFIPPEVTCPRRDYRPECAEIASSGGCNGTDGMDPLRTCFSSCLPPASPQRSHEYCYGSQGFPLRVMTPVKGSVVSNSTYSLEKMHNRTFIYPNYHPRKKPWFKASQTCGWTKPFVLASVPQDVGILMRCAVHSVDGRRLGAVGGAFSFRSISQLLSELLFHDQSISLLLLTDGSLLSSSLTREAFLAQTGIDYTQQVPKIEALRPSSRPAKLIRALIERYGTLAAAYERRAVLVHSDALLMHLPVQLPANLELLLVTAYPLDATTEQLNYASVTALGVVLLLISFTVPLGLAIVWCALRALRRLEGDMQEVAAMRLEGMAQQQLSWVSEAMNMQLSFARMVEHLEVFRQYLPQMVLQDEEEEEPQNEADGILAPPGLETHAVAIVFTDIRASTSIWEAAPDAMKKALKVHNASIRETLLQHQGYEVKTIGDAFMIAFSEPVDAVQFGLRIHLVLRAAEWPTALLDVPLCAPRNCWKGLTIRVGVNFGSVSPERNELTGRYDYFGHTVNVASRLESAGVPGSVTVLRDVWNSIESALSDAVVTDFDVVKLKGVAEPLRVVRAWPASLALRRGNPLKEPCESECGSCASYCSSSKHGTDNHSRHAGQYTKQAIPMTAVSGWATAAVMQQSCDASLTATDSTTVGLHVVANCLERTRGVLLSVAGSLLLAAWNVSRAVLRHEESALRCASMLKELLPSLISVGALTGHMQYGHVASSFGRFFTIVGETVPQCTTLCMLAQRGNLSCLYVLLRDGGVEAPYATLNTVLRECLEPYTPLSDAHLGKRFAHVMKLLDSV